MRIATWVSVLALAGCVGLQSSIGDSVPPLPGYDTGDGELQIGDLIISPSEVDFGSVTIGEQGSASVVLSYSGDGAAALSEVSLEGGDGALIIDNVTALPAVVEPGLDAVVDLLFAPASELTYEGILYLRTNQEGAEEIQVPVLGTGYDDGSGSADEGDVSLSHNSLDFGLVDVGDSESRSLTISNIGSAQLLLSDFSMGDTDLSYSVDFALPQVLDSGESKEVQIDWTPSAVGSLSSYVDVISDDPDTPEARVVVTGDAEELCDVCAPMISVDTGGKKDTQMSFGVLVGWGDDTQTVTVSNIGDQTLTITRVYVNNDGVSPSSSFSVNWSGPTETVEPGVPTNFQITYSATSSAVDIPYSITDENILHIQSDAANGTDWQVDLYGLAL